MQGRCVSAKGSLYVHSSIMEFSNGEQRQNRKTALPNGHQARYTAETVLRTCPKTYRKIVHRTRSPKLERSPNLQNLPRLRATVRAIRKREAQI